MRVAVLSDTHGREAWVRRALDAAAAHKADFIIHCGDIDEAATVALFPAGTHFVFGNCDQDREAIRLAIADGGGTLHEPFGHFELEGRNIAFVHGDDHRLLRELEASGAYDFLFYGHTHIAREHRIGRTRVINPGALHRAAVKTFVLLDLPQGTVERVELSES